MGWEVSGVSKKNYRKSPQNPTISIVTLSIPQKPRMETLKAPVAWGNLFLKKEAFGGFEWVWGIILVCFWGIILICLGPSFAFSCLKGSPGAARHSPWQGEHR